jgi:hypothetical protein
MKSIWLFLVALALAVACETSTTREPFGLVGLGACAAGTSGEAGATGGAGMGGVAGEAGATGGVAGATGGADAGPPDWTADPQILA